MAEGSFADIEEVGVVENGKAQQLHEPAVLASEVYPHIVDVLQAVLFILRNQTWCPKSVHTAIIPCAHHLVALFLCLFSPSKEA